MTDSSKRTNQPASEAERDRDGEGAAASGPRRPYSPPRVDKRRSVNYATLVTGGGTSGALTSG